MNFLKEIKKLDYKRISYHILFWIAITLFFDIMTAIVYDVPFLDHISQDLKYYTPTDIFGVYFMIYFLIPKFLLKKKNYKFIIYSLFFLFVLIIVITLPIQFLGKLITSDTLTGADISIIKEFKKFVYNNFLVTVTVKLMIIGIASSIKIAKIWIKSQKRQQNLITEKLEIAIQLKESELKHLKSQLNPHFLFNTLNNLYSLTLEKSDKAPEVVLKISSLLDYVLYKCNVPFIELDKEIENIKNYIDLQKIRYGENSNISIDINKSNKSILIAPLLILPLVENAFKHGLDKNVGSGFINIQINLTENDKINISVENSLKGENNHEGEGIGLINLKKRLKLQYQKKHQLIINKTDTTFTAKMCIKLN